MNKLRPNNQLPTRLPDIGKCELKTKWNNKSMINDCRKCLSKKDEYGNKKVFCSNLCLSKYDTNHECSTSSPVAKDIKQCENPCQQVFQNYNASMLYNVEYFGIF